MTMLRRIYALMERISELDGLPPIMTAVFDDGHSEKVPEGETAFVWAIRRAMQKSGPRIVKFACESSPTAADDETEFFHCLTESGDLSSLWDEE